MTPQEFLLQSKVEPIPGDTICWRNATSAISAAIMWRQGGFFNHVSIPVSTFAMVESHMFGGVQVSGMMCGGDWVYLRLKEPYQETLNESLFKEALEDQLLRKTKYDWRGIIGALFNAPKFQKSAQLFCSELLEYCLAKGGLVLCPRRPRGFVWPNHVYESELYEPMGYSLKKGIVISGLNDEMENKEYVDRKIEETIKEEKVEEFTE